MYRSIVAEHAILTRGASLLVIIVGVLAEAAASQRETLGADGRPTFAPCPGPEARDKQAAPATGLEPESKTYLVSAPSGLGFKLDSSVYPKTTNLLCLLRDKHGLSLSCAPHAGTYVFRFCPTNPESKASEYRGEPIVVTGLPARTAEAIRSADAMLYRKFVAEYMCLSVSFHGSTSAQFQQQVKQLMREIPPVLCEDLFEYGMRFIGCRSINEAVDEFFPGRFSNVRFEVTNGFYSWQTVIVSEWMWTDRSSQWILNPALRPVFFHEVGHALTHLWGKRLASELKSRGRLSKQQKDELARLRKNGLFGWAPLWTAYVNESRRYLARPDFVEHNRLVERALGRGGVGTYIIPEGDGFAQSGCSETLAELIKVGLLRQSDALFGDFPETYGVLRELFNRKYETEILPAPSEIKP